MHFGYVRNSFSKDFIKSGDQHIDGNMEATGFSTKLAHGIPMVKMVGSKVDLV